MGKQPVCVVVGMGDSLGLDLARRFGQGGCALALVGRRADAVARYAEMLKAEGFDARPYPGDAADRDSVRRTFDAIRSGMGDPDILIYNAAIVEQQTLHDSDPDYFERCFAANASGALWCAQQVIPAMKARGTGTILFSGGVLAFEPIPGWSVTAVGKAALRSMALSLDQELRNCGIHVASVAIHGSIQRDPFYTPARIAETFWQLHCQPTGEFEREVHFRKDGDA